MNITLLISKNPFCENNAGANRLINLIEGVADLGVIVRLFICNGYNSSEEKAKFGIQGVHNNINYEYIMPMLIQGYWKVRIYNYLGQFIRNRRLIYELNKRLKNSIEIIWTDASVLSFRFAVYFKNRNPNAQLFVELSEYLDIHLYNKGNIFQRWQGNFRQTLFEKRAFFSYNGIALMTQNLLRHYKCFHEPKPNLLHLPMTVDLKRFKGLKKPLLEFQSPYIAFVGVMNDAKDGVSILINAFNSIKNKFPQYKVYLIGGWNYDTPTHLNLIVDFDLQERVFWMKEYDRNKIPNIICNADLLVLPRPASKQAQGGFPTKLGEYLATGNPVCATSVGEIPNYLKDNESVFFAKPGSVESFAEAMDRALSNPENAKRVGLNGRKVAEREFNKDIQANKLYDFFKELLEERRDN
jgi:glycosyltransferase involved in cell wall biosynthesis